ncbi:diguanylate cyclase (GGDEF) domain-containing protein [Sporobacter termitidis DSM 10068]|uniref:Diguanylate cyclase (GGDEF) domain-containing protein n=1 Tax=Sporobacter termitidis DSM 10068 TaxID=1123282 RepID=A0A1M5XQF6_9FIRM|nr:GGDEF domain-containing protein [Sporobacter termitidis]SHI01902.1 diguanylate cyclase (GGDEF) domain-containing protein [Sporobacter termitidis DSM 10068]
MAILVLIYLNTQRRWEQMLTEQKLFMLLVYTEAFILIVDSLMWLLDGRPGALTRNIYIAVTVLYYILTPGLCMVWYFYVDFHVYKDAGHLKKVLLPAVAPAFINLVLSVLSAFNGLLFYIDGGNVYHRGRLFFIMALAAFFYLAYAWVLTIIRRRAIPKQYFVPIAVFSFFPFIGGVVQWLYYGLSLIWACTTIATLIIFISIQNIQLYTDYLTGLFNRRQLDKYLQSKGQHGESGLLAGLMIDLDSFKTINDMYGHSAGDQALIDTAELLKKTFRKNDLIARFGGDEFVVVMHVQSRDDLQKAIDRLNENVAQFNAQERTPYTISLSIGYDCCFDDSVNAKDFLKHIDDLMYQHKNIGPDGRPPQDGA